MQTRAEIELDYFKDRAKRSRKWNANVVVVEQTQAELAQAANRSRGWKKHIRRVKAAATDAR